MTIQELTDLILAQAKEKGWGATKEEIQLPEQIALIHSEISEIFEAYRHKNFEGEHGVQEEFADVLMRVLHVAGALEIDIEAELLKKIERNKKRDWKWDNLHKK